MNTATTLEKIAAFADLHGRPRASRIINGAVRIYSVDRIPNGDLVIVAEDVTTFAQARAVLGY